MKLVACLLCVTFMLSASDQTHPEKLTLDEAIEIVKSKNLEIQAAAYDEKSAHWDVKTASGHKLGKLDFIQDIARSNDPGNVFGFKLASREAAFGDFGAEEFMNNYMAGQPDYTTPPRRLNYPGERSLFQSKLTYTIPLYTGGKLRTYAEIARTVEQLKRLDKESMIDEKIYETKKTFYDMALLVKSIKNLNKVLDNIATLENMTQNMIAEGYAKNVDLLEVQAKRSNVERLVLQMVSNQKLLYHYLSFLLNREVSAIATPAEDVPLPPIDNALVISHNLDIQKASEGLNIHEKMITLSKAGYLPEIGAFADVSTSDNSFLGDANDHKAYSVGARLSWNIFNGGINAGSIEKARIEKMKMQTQVELAKKGVSLKLDKIRTEIASFDHDIQSLAKELELAEQIYKNYEGRYKEHLSSMSDVIIKQSLLIEKILQLQMIKNKRNERVFALDKLANGAR